MFADICILIGVLQIADVLRELIVVIKLSLFFCREPVALEALI